MRLAHRLAMVHVRIQVFPIFEVLIPYAAVTGGGSATAQVPSSLDELIVCVHARIWGGLIVTECAGVAQ